MNPLFRLCSRAWIVVLLAAVVFAGRTAAVNLARAAQLSALAGGDALATDAASPTGYAGGVRKLVLPEFNHEAQQWITTTQRMLARGEWRVRHLDADNAPLGRATLAPSPYRWWLALVAQADRAASGRPIGQSVERAALLAGPALQILLLVSATLFAARRFGGLAATLLAASLSLGFPFAGNFLTPFPGDRALAQVFAVWTLLPLAAAILGRRAGPKPFVGAALAGAALLWVDAGSAVLLLGGVLLGGTAAAWWSRARVRADGSSFSSTPFDSERPLPPWRAWAWTGAGATLLAWLAEYAPAHLGGLHVEFLHPLHALAWLGAGELLHRASAFWLGEQPVRGPRAWAAVVLAASAVLALPVAALVAGGPGLLGPAAYTARLALLPGVADAANFGTWALRASPSALATTLLPLVLLAVAAGRIKRGQGEPLVRAAALLAVGPVLAALGVAWFRVGHWGTVGAALAVLLAVLAAYTPRRHFLSSFLWPLAALLALGPSLDLLPPKPAAVEAANLSEGEREALLHRDLAHWLAARAPEGGAIVLAPPALTSALHYFGGVRGLGTPDPDNEAGFGAAVRICGTSSTDEAEALVRKRGVTHVVLPSWDDFLDQYALLGNNQPEKSLVALLRRWLPPRWLRPVLYAPPPAEISGERSAVVFEVTEVQEQTVAMARLAEYFIDAGQPDAAAQIAAALTQEFAEDPVGLITRAEVAVARNDRGEFGRVFRTLKPVLDRGEDTDLPWDRRVALAIVLGQAKQTELAKPRLQACLAGADEARLRQLSVTALYRLLLMAKAYGCTFEDAALREKAPALLPAELRTQL